MIIFCNYFKEHLIKIYTKTHQIAPFFKIFSKELALEHQLPCTACSVATCIIIYSSGKIIYMPLLNLVMYIICAFIAF